MKMLINEKHSYLSLFFVRLSALESLWLEKAFFCHEDSKALRCTKFYQGML
jgi:hypothetical protein